MGQLRKNRYSVHNTISTREAEAFHIYAEILLRGYALLTCRIPRSPLVAISTMGLNVVDHPEITVVAKYEDEAFGLLQYLAKQVLDGGQQFQEGVYGTAFFGELIFSQSDCDLDALDLVDDGISTTSPHWLQCSLPCRPLAPVRGEEDRCRIEAA